MSGLILMGALIAIVWLVLELIGIHNHPSEYDNRELDDDTQDEY